MMVCDDIHLETNIHSLSISYDIISYHIISYPFNINQCIGLRDNLQETPRFHGKFYGFRLRFSRENQSIESK